jgi:hypothetical protein
MKDGKMAQPSFILSSGRSGSTLLSNILNAHSKILSVPESSFLIVLLNMYKNKNRFTERDYKNIVDRIWLRKEEHSKLWNINNEQLLRTLLAKNPQNLEEIMHEIYLSYSGAGAISQATIIVDKNPLYYRFLGIIQKSYPNAKYILLVRDYRDRMVSLPKSKFSMRIATNLVKGIGWNKRNLFFLKMGMHNNAIIVKYEDMVTNPEKIIGEICNFLGVPFEYKMLNFHQEKTHNYDEIDASEEFKTRMRKMHKRSSSQINTSRIGIWNNQLSKNTISILETFCGSTGEIYGYKRYSNNKGSKNILNRIVMMPSITVGVVLLFLKRKSFLLPYSLQKILVNLLKVNQVKKSNN